MRIAVIGSRGIPASHGGVERHVEELYSRLVRMGFDVDVFARRHYVEPQRDKVDWERDLKVGRYRGMRMIVSRAPLSQGIEAFAHSFWATAKALSGNYDLYHYHALGPSCFARLPLWLGKRVVVTVHGLDWQREKWGPAGRAFLRQCERFVGRRVPEIVCVSEDLKRHFESVYGRKAAYLPNGVTIPDRIEAAEIPEWGLKAGRYLLFCGRITQEKGVHTLIEAFRRGNFSREWTLAIVGGADQNPAYVNSLKKQAGEGVVFTGFVYGAALTRLISNCRFTVNPSTLEGLPQAVLEAHALGKRALVSDIPPHREIVREDAWVFPAGDVQALYERLKELLAGEQASSEPSLVERVRREYDWDRIAEKTAEIFRTRLPR